MKNKKNNMLFSISLSIINKGNLKVVCTFLKKKPINSICSCRAYVTQEIIYLLSSQA